MHNKENQLLISAILTCKNNERYLSECINSLLSQNYKNFEIVIVDGASTDNTINILKEYGDKIRWISELDRHAGEGFNKALKLAAGEILYWINSDDVAEPNAFQEAISILNKENSIDILYGNQYIIDESSYKIGKYYSHDFDIVSQIKGNFIPVGSVFIKNSLLRKYSYTFDESLTVNQDIDTWLFFTNRAKFKYINSFWSSFRKHANSGTYNEKYLNNRIQSTLISYRKFLERVDIGNHYKRIMKRQIKKIDSSLRFGFYLEQGSVDKAINIGLNYFKSNPMKIVQNPLFIKQLITLYFSGNNKNSGNTKN